MLYNLSLLVAILALTSNAGAAPSSTTTNSLTPTPSPLLPLPPFSGTFANKYPPLDEVPPTDTPLVQKWVSELNLTDVPNWPVVPFTAGGDPQNPGAIPEGACDWTETNCINKDLTTCPLGVWGLTYDDGPTEFSPQLYDFLDKTDQKATLFYIGSNVVQNWQAARRACGAGHHIAVHTWSHHASTSLTNEQFIAEVKYTELAIKELCGFTPTYFRPPFGDIDNRIRGLLWAMGYTSVIWDYDTDDWKMAPGGQRTESQVDQAFDQWVAAAPQDKTGHITLEHELYQNTVNAAIKNLPKIQATWKAMSVAACMNDSHPYQEKNITLATMDGAKTGVDNNNGTSSTKSTNANGSQPTSSGQGLGENGAEVKNAAISSVGLLSEKVAVLVVAFITIAIVTI
ncbi:chitin deacetylase [Haplosporangium sp. Z 767]|nr:chitin deacetylase [Haplosporangium sp. Z 767]KAF9189583.1 chitin deacetylase [Haplosporangium sp. Z 11]